MSWNIEWNVWKCIPRKDYLSSFQMASQWYLEFFFSGSKFHYFISVLNVQSQGQFSTALHDLEILMNYILNGRIFHARNRNVSFSSPRQYPLSLRRPMENQCTSSKIAWQGWIRRQTSWASPSEAGWDLLKRMHHWLRSSPESRLLWLPRLRASFSPGY